MCNRKLDYYPVLYHKEDSLPVQAGMLSIYHEIHVLCKLIISLFFWMLSRAHIEFQRFLPPNDAGMLDNKALTSFFKINTA